MMLFIRLQPNRLYHKIIIARWRTFYLRLPLHPMALLPTKKPIIIAGPCGAESEEQLRLLVEGFTELPIDMFRAGVWKPRSKPGHFEGRGKKPYLG